MPVSPIAHPSNGYGEPYSQDMRAKVLMEFNNGTADSATNRMLQRQHLYPHPDTIMRWVQRKVDEGHALPYRRSGNKRATILRGPDFMFLALYRSMYPRAKAAEINAFLYRCNFGNLDFDYYHPSAITEAEKRLGLTKKRGSTTAFQALMPINRWKREQYWTMAYPFGIADIRIQDMIDLDEMGEYPEDTNRSIGKSPTFLRVREAGTYSRCDKATLLLAVSGDPNGRRWKRIWNEGGTTVEVMVEFIGEILETLPHGDEGRRYCFTMDNLTSHHHARIRNMIEAAGHRLAFRAPYWAVDGPIEYVFNTIQNMLTINMHRIKNVFDLVHELNNAVASLPQDTIYRYFEHCGFWRN